MAALNKQKCFEILEIEETSDLKVIKKAYAGMVKKYHPEVEPEKYEEVRKAYEYLSNLVSLNSEKISEEADKADFVIKIRDIIESEMTTPVEEEESEVEDEFNQEIKNLATFEDDTPEISDYFEFSYLYDRLPNLVVDEKYMGRVYKSFISRYEFSVLRRKKKLYFDALKSKDFIRCLTWFMHKGEIDSQTADILKKDIQKVSDEGDDLYDDLLEVLADNRIEKKWYQRAKEHLKILGKVIFEGLCLTFLILGGLYLLVFVFQFKYDISSKFGLIVIASTVILGQLFVFIAYLRQILKYW